RDVQRPPAKCLKRRNLPYGMVVALGVPLIEHDRGETMKLTTPSALAAVFLITVPAYAATEFDCTQAQEAQAQSNEVKLSDDLVQKRQQAREAEIARMKERFIRASTAAQPAGAPAQPATRQ